MDELEEREATAESTESRDSGWRRKARLLLDSDLRECMLEQLFSKKMMQKAVSCKSKYQVNTQKIIQSLSYISVTTV